LTRSSISFDVLYYRKVLSKRGRGDGTATVKPSIVGTKLSDVCVGATNDKNCSSSSKIFYTGSLKFHMVPSSRCYTVVNQRKPY
jgi:hypothetical protein